MTNITIAGASGFVGKNLLSNLSNIQNINIKALSRSKIESGNNINWSQTDLFSLSSTIKSLEKTDIAIFLVHSMMPSTRLFQGSFRDTDLIIADNFVRACRRNNVKKIVYLGGIIPEGKTSEHLESRKEVEDIFVSSGIDSVIIRAGLIVGNGGSSFEILKNLSLNLPIMLLPKWTSNTTQTIYIDDLINIISHVMFESNSTKIINAVTQEEQSYAQLIKETNQYLHRSQIMIPIPINYTKLSKFWVSKFGQSEMSLVSPLVDSLLCDISKISPSKEILHYINFQTYKSMLPQINKSKISSRTKMKLKEDNNVRSIQRMASGKYLDSKDVANFYFEWLPAHMKYIIYVEEQDQNVYFKLKGIDKPLLVLEYIKCQANHDRAKFHITGGLLTKTTDTGWLEFRNIDHGKFLLASINEFRPALPWYIYKYTQAIFHSLVMNSFKKDLEKKN